MISSYLWKNGNAKVSAHQLAQKIENGGLKMTHIETYLQTVALNWVKRFSISKHGWQNLFYTILNIKNNEPVWELDAKSLNLLAKNIQNPFWKSIIISWKHIVEIKAQNDHIEILKTPLWNTFFVQNCNLKALKQRFIQNGCVYIKDLINYNKNQFLTYSEFCTSYNVKLTKLDFFALIKSIPGEWKRKIENVLSDINTLDLSRDYILDYCLKKEKLSNTTYWWILEKGNLTPNVVQKWSNLIDFDAKLWPKYCSIPFIVTMEAKLREFQFRLLNRYITTNHFLKTIKIKESDICDFCQTEIETIRHLFVFCPVVKRLWQDLLDWMYPNFVLLEPLSEKVILFGIYPATPDTKLFNMLLIITKRYIFQCKCLEKVPDLKTLINIIKHYYEIEQCISNQLNSKYQDLNYKWSALSDKLT